MSGVSFSTIENAYRATGKHDINKSHHPVGVDSFMAIDGEGETVNGVHRYVLLGAGQDQIEDSSGLHWRDCIEFLYSHFQPKQANVGFFLGYDFTQMLKTLPENRARALLTIEGKEARRSKSPKMHGKFLPVDVDEWQFDIVGSKRLAFRCKPCDCLTVKCDHKKGPWMYVCDAGPFFQTSFLNVINPTNWAEPIVSEEEYETIKAGKEARAGARLGPEMRFYNRLENEILERVMGALNKGFKELDVTLSAQQWFGPGQAAQKWMSGRAPTAKALQENVPEHFLEAARKSYYGGWFEQQAHGHIPGVSYEYDINSAYPAIIRDLPCLLHGVYEQGTGKPPSNPGSITLVRVRCWGRAPYSDYKRGQAIGSMLHRDPQGRICRPIVTEGWFWLHELEASMRAKCTTRITKDRWQQWIQYTPCDCPPPLRRVANLYEMRLQVGKDTILGKTCKLLYNSMYGKTAQSVGFPVFGNPVYASLITAGCRAMILDAIATHPGGKHDVVMVATDALFFLSPHPLLPLGKGLGEWSYTERRNLTLFKPGVYWDDNARESLAAGIHPSFKARGVSARDFAQTIGGIDEEFSRWGERPPPIADAIDLAASRTRWPRVSFKSGFAMVTCLQALVRNDWGSAGHVDSCNCPSTVVHDPECPAKELSQSANPIDKRCDLWRDDSVPGRPIYRSEPFTAGPNAHYRHWGNVTQWDYLGGDFDDFSSVPYEKRFGLDDPFSDEVTQRLGVTPDEHQIGRGMFRLLTGAE